MKSHARLFDYSLWQVFIAISVIMSWLLCHSCYVMESEFVIHTVDDINDVIHGLGFH